MTNPAPAGDTLTPDLVVELQQLVFRYFYCLDELDYEGMLRLLSPDIHWSRLGIESRGIDEVRASLQGRSTTRRIRHVLTNNVMLERQGDRARGICYITSYMFENHQPVTEPPRIRSPFLMNVLHCGFTRRPEGWRISELKLDIQFRFEGVDHPPPPKG